MQQGFIRIALSLLLLAVNLLLSAAPARADEIENDSGTHRNTNTELAIQQQGGDLIFQWHLPEPSGVQAASLAAATVSELPHMPYNGLMLPLQLQTIIIDESASVNGASVAAAPFTIDVEQMRSLPYRQALQYAEVEEPKAIDWEEKYRNPEPSYELPTESVFVLREGRVRGTRVAVVAFSPIFGAGDEVRVVSDFQARLSNASVFNEGIETLILRDYQSVRAAQSPAGTTSEAVDYAPTNPAVEKNALKIHVSTVGIQMVPGSDMLAYGVPPSTPLSALQLAYRGTEVAIEIADSGNNGTLDASDSFRFYARPRSDSWTVGDYWNQEEIYWLTYNGTNPKRMAVRNVLPNGSSGATIRPIAVEKGIWESNKVYESTMPGDDGDNWFHEAMLVTPSQASDPSSYPSITVNLNHKLTPATSSMTSNFTLTGSSNSVANHKLQVNLGTTSSTINWTNLQYYESWSHTISSTVAHPTSLQLTLLPGSLDSDIRLDKIYWEQPVNLDFSNKGAAFSGVPGTWRYQLANVSGDATLYDVTDPLLPQRLWFPSGTNPQFEDGPDPRDYVLVTVGDLGRPRVTAHTPVVWSPAMRGNAVYIADKQFHDELQPLIDFRSFQGYEPIIVDLQSIYDSWSFGQSSPEAIRTMLQYAANNWALPPLGAVAVGDTTLDPKNYLGRQDGIHNVNLFPTFLESNDPWLGVTACDACFAQLDDPHPLDGILDEDFLIDIWFGRFSIQDESQLQAVVDKILTYSRPTDISLNSTWRQKSVFVADNYVRSDCTLDSAGDFAQSSDDIILNYQSPGILSEKVYYDPSPTLDPSCAYYNPVQKSGHYNTPEDVQTAAVQAYRAGAGLITYDGHSNHFQNGRTEANGSYIMGFNEILQMNNAATLPILMEMTCYTGQFQYVSTTGTTMDERFQRQPNGGAVAIFAPAGLSVATGHHFLQEGFHQYLWSRPAYHSRMGELIEASYLSLFNNSTCCQDVRFTFALLGDPFTNALVMSPNKVFVPVIQD